MGTIILQDGTIMRGKSFGALGSSMGEIAFNTSTCGYQEILTDPSCTNQILVMTYPEIGNCGINNNDFESSIAQLAGFVVKNYCKTYSHYKASQSLSEYLIKKNIIALEGIDTRSLTQIIRKNGTLNAFITSDDLNRDAIDKKLKELQNYKTQEDIVMQVTCKNRYMLNHSGKINVAYIDYGTRNGIIDSLIERNCRVTIFPADTKADEILENNFDALFLSNGPGNPQDCKFEIEQLKLLVGKIPIFGVSLGFQLLAIALGASTYKLPYGHRGCNHPVINLENNKILITTQNHGYTIDKNTMVKIMRPTYKNLNDDTIEGFEVDSLNIYAIQFNIDSKPNTDDVSAIFDEWINLMKKNC